MDINTSNWPYVGATTNTQYYLIEPNILAVVPQQGAVDTLESARENRDFQNDYFRQHNTSGVVLVFAERMASLDKEARRVYQQELDVKVINGAALVGVSLLVRAIGAFLLGLSKPKVPFKMCGTLDDALAWARSINASASANEAS